MGEEKKGNKWEKKRMRQSQTFYEL